MSQRTHPARGPDDIRRRPDGSIDLDHYRRAARVARAGALRATFAGIGAALAAVLSGRGRDPGGAAGRCEAG